MMNGAEGPRLPEHVNPKEPGRTATAPYNFVPLPEAVVRAGPLPDHDRYAPEHHSGYFTVTLTTESPLYIRTPFPLKDFLRQDTGADKDRPFREQVKNSPGFFHAGEPDKPVIPGSSLRGMLRQVVEVISYSKVQEPSRRPLVYRAVADMSVLGQHYRRQLLGDDKAANPKTDLELDYPSPRLKAGYLERRGGDLMIRPAQEFCRESFVRVEDRDLRKALGREVKLPELIPVWVEPVARRPLNRGVRNGKQLRLHVAVTPHVEAAAADGLQPAWVVVSNSMGGQHPKHWHCAVYERDMSPSVRLVKVKEELWQVYETDRGLHRAGPRVRDLKPGEPIFYLMDGDEPVFFGPTVMFRLPFKQAPADLVPPVLCDTAVIDYAEALFGFVPDGRRKTARAGRVSVTDAYLLPGQAEPVWLPGAPILPKILGTPKPTSFQLYLTQRHSDNRDGLHYYDSATPADTVLRGQKRYWHRNEDPPIMEEREVPPDDKQHTQCSPVRPAVSFRFRVYFENLTAAELGALCWALHPCGLPGRSYCHSLGMGKPLGMGAVTLRATLHRISRKDRYGSLFADAGWQTGEQPSVDLSGDQALAELVEPFEKHVLLALGAKAPVTSLADLPRIQRLLALMEWPGPDPGQTAYMLHTDRRIKERAVLPDPLMIAPLPAKPLKLPAKPAQTPANREETRLEWVQPMPGKPAWVRTEQGEELECRNMQKRDQLPSRFRAMVTRRNGKVIRAVWKSWW